MRCKQNRRKRGGLFDVVVNDPKEAGGSRQILRSHLIIQYQRVKYLRRPLVQSASQLVRGNDTIQ